MGVSSSDAGDVSAGRLRDRQLRLPLVSRTADTPRSGGRQVRGRGCPRRRAIRQCPPSAKEARVAEPPFVVRFASTLAEDARYGIALLRRNGWRFALLFALVSLPLWGFGALAGEVHEGEAIAFDRPLLDFAHAHATPGLDRLALLLGMVGYLYGVVPFDIALVLLLFDDYGSFYGTLADQAKTSALIDAMYSLLSGCMEDEFQQAIYANPDMNLDEINALYARLASEYGLQEVYGYLGTEWVLVSHTFQSPLYYISYAASMVPALELFDLAQSDPSAAKTAYFNIIMRDSYAGLDEVLKQNGLDSVFSETTIARIAEILKQYV